jgi:micrococcal nuclease
MGCTNGKLEEVDTINTINKHDFKVAHKNNLINKEVNINEIKPIKFTPEFSSCEYYSLIDGDTIKIKGMLKIPAGPLQWSLRLNGIDTPESRTTNKEEKAAGLLAKEVMKRILENNPIRIEVTGLDKYGRLLGNIYANEVNLSDWMVENGFACKYIGKKKEDYRIWFNPIYKWNTIPTKIKLFNIVTE